MKDKSKVEIIKSIMQNIENSKKEDFEKKITPIFRKYYKKKCDCTYENPSSNGGDRKNDGYVKEKHIYYQLYSPEHFERKKILKKYKEDFDGLLKHIANGQWTKDIKEFIFLINQNNKLANIENEINKMIEPIIKKYKFNVVNKFEDLNYVEEILDYFDFNELENIAEQINVPIVRVPVKKNFEIGEQKLFELLEKLSKIYTEKIYDLIPKNTKEYTRISSDEKIKINDLDEKENEITRIIANLGIIDELVKNLNNNLDNKYELAKNIVISYYYKHKANNKKGIKLYNEIIEDLSRTLDKPKLEVEAFVVYIFDKCEIFEKE